MTNRFAHGVHLKRPCKVSTCRNLTARGTYGPNSAMSQVDLNLSACDSDSSIRQRLLVRISGGPQANDELASASELPLPGAAGSPAPPRRMFYYSRQARSHMWL